MIDYYLKFTNQTQAESVLYQDDQPLYKNIDTLGIIYNMTDPENPVAEPGWHVNVRVVDEDGTPLNSYRVFPVTPRRVWA